MRRTLAILLSLLLFTVSADPDLARADSSPIPGLSEVDFTAAIREDRVRLRQPDISLTFHKDSFIKEVERYNTALAIFGDEQNMIPSHYYAEEPDGQTIEISDQFYNSLSYLSLSPDGTRIFTVSGGLPLIYDFDTQSMKLLAPDKEMDPQYYEKFYKTIYQQIEDQGVVWSQDGKYIAMSFPRKVLAMFKFGVNILLIDVEAGTAEQLVKGLPNDLSPFSSGYTGGSPFRAVFSDSEPIVYYEVYFMEFMQYKYNAIRARRLDTGETTTISLFDSQITTSDAYLWKTERGFMQTIAHTMREGPQGIAIRGAGKPDILVLRDPGALEASVQSRLIDFKGSRGVLYSYSPVSYYFSQMIQLFSLDDLSGGLFSRGIVIRPDRDPAERLLQLNLSDVLDELGAVYKQSARDAYQLPGNAALSPDGRYLLLSASNAARNPMLYVYDFRNDALGAVDLSEVETGEPALFAIYDTSSDRGLRWMGNNRLLVGYNRGSRIYELTIQPTK